MHTAAEWNYKNIITEHKFLEYIYQSESNRSYFLSVKQDI